MTAKQFLAWVTYGPANTEVVTRTELTNSTRYRDEVATVNRRVVILFKRSGEEELTLFKRSGGEEHGGGSGTAEQSVGNKGPHHPHKVIYSPTQSNLGGVDTRRATSTASWDFPCLLLPGKEKKVQDGLYGIRSLKR